MLFSEKFIVQNISDYRTILKLLVFAILLIIVIYFLTILMKNKYLVEVLRRFKILLIFIIFALISVQIFIKDYNYERFREGDEIEETFLIEEDITNKEEKNEKNKFIIKSLNNNSNKEKILLNTYHKTDLKPGNIINIKARISKPESNRNPKLFNYKSYLKSKYIHSIINAKKNEIIILNKNSDSERLQLNLDSILDEKNANFMKSVILGKSSYIDKESLKKVRDTGLAHFLAVSGFHIGIIYLLCIKILNKLLSVSKRYSQIISLIIIFVYIKSINYPVSAIRAFLMILIITISEILHLRTEQLNTVGACGILILLSKPLYAISISFQLSFLGIVAISLLSDKFKTRKLSINKILAISFGVTPISIYYFNTYSPIFILSNILISGVFSLSVIFTIVSLVIFNLWQDIGKIIAIVPNNLLNFINYLIEILDIGVFKIKSFSIVELLIIYLAIFILLNIININRLPKKFLTIIFYSSIMVSAILSVTNIDKNVYIRFIDVGQGDSIWIEYNNKNYMIDSGGVAFSDFDTGEMILEPLLVKNGVRKIDSIIISHFDIDHAKGFLYLLDNIKIANLYIGHSPTDNELYRDVYTKAKENNVRVIDISEIKRKKKKEFLEIQISEDLKIDLLAPNKKRLDLENENNNSLIALLSCYGRKVLFTGDIEEKREKDKNFQKTIVKMINKADRWNSSSYLDRKNKGTRGKIDILKVTHHGSKTSSTEEFLKLTKSKVGIIQCGENNFGHPNEEVLERYNKMNMDIYRNDEDGLIDIVIDMYGNVEIKSYLRDEKSFKNFIIQNSEDLIIMIIYILISYLIIENIKSIYLSEEYYRSRMQYIKRSNYEL